MAKRKHNHSDCRATTGIGDRTCKDKDCDTKIGTVMYDYCRIHQDIADLRIITARHADQVYRPPVPWYGLRPS